MLPASTHAHILARLLNIVMGWFLAKHQWLPCKYCSKPGHSECYDFISFLVQLLVIPAVDSCLAFHFVFCVRICSPYPPPLPLACKPSKGAVHPSPCTNTSDKPPAPFLLEPLRPGPLRSCCSLPARPHGRGPRTSLPHHRPSLHRPARHQPGAWAAGKGAGGLGRRPHRQEVPGPREGEGKDEGFAP